MIGAEDKGLTLEALANRLEALQREHTEKLEALERENAELRDEVSVLRGLHTPRYRHEERTSESSKPEEERMSRRRMLSRAGAAAAGLVVAGALTQRDIREAKAATQFGQIICTHNEERRGAVEGTNTASFSYGVWGNATTGVYGTSNVGGSGCGVKGYNSSTLGASAGVYGENESGPGVRGWGKGGGAGVQGDSTVAGVLGESTDGIGVKGVGKHGVRGESSAPELGAVEGHNSGTGGIGVKGKGATGVQGVSNTAGRGAVEGSMENASGYGVWGNSWGVGVRGTGGTHGVHGIGTKGYGGQFEGGRAQMRLVPKGTAGRPTTGSHTKGEIYMDSAGALFVCTAAGTPGTWRRVTTTAT